MQYYLSLLGFAAIDSLNLLAFAVIDDIGALLVIAAFYGWN